MWTAAHVKAYGQDCRVMLTMNVPGACVPASMQPARVAELDFRSVWYLDVLIDIRHICLMYVEPYRMGSHGLFNQHVIKCLHRNVHAAQFTGLSAHSHGAMTLAENHIHSLHISWWYGVCSLTTSAAKPVITPIACGRQSHLL